MTPEQATKISALLSSMIVETVEEMHPEPVPENIVYTAFQAHGIAFDLFTVVLETTIRSGLVKRAGQHRLVKGGAA